MIRALLISWLLCAASTAAANCVKQNFPVAIDVGHSPLRPGATSARGATEFSFNEELAKLTLAELRASGFSSSFIVEQPAEELGLAQRTERAEKEHASLFLSIHHDSTQPRFMSAWIYQGRSHTRSDQFRGYSIFYSQRNRLPEASLNFCQLLGSALLIRGLVPTLHHAARIRGENRDLVDPHRGIYRFDDLIVLRTAQMPAALLEAGVIVNSDEEVRLLKPAYRQKLTSAICQAVTEFCAEQGRPLAQE